MWQKRVAEVILLLAVLGWSCIHYYALRYGAPLADQVDSERKKVLMCNE